MIELIENERDIREKIIKYEDEEELWNEDYRYPNDFILYKYTANEKEITLKKDTYYLYKFVSYDDEGKVDYECYKLFNTKDEHECINLNKLNTISVNDNTMIMYSETHNLKLFNDKCTYILRNKKEKLENQLQFINSILSVLEKNYN